MRVHLIKKQTIEDFAETHGRSRISLQIWLERIKYANWTEPGDIRKTFGTVDFIGKGSNRLVFDIGGNEFRMICKYVFGKKDIHLFVCWIGTHAEYDSICSRNMQYTISIC